MKTLKTKAIEYDRISFPRYRQVASLINRDSGKLLDIGARTAKLKNHVSGKIDYHALDFYNKGDIGELKRKGIKAMNGSIEKIPFEDKHFDIIILTEILEHLPNPGISLEEVRRVLKDDGVVVVSVPNCDLRRRIYRMIMNSPKILLGIKKAIRKHEEGGHLYMFTKEHIKLLFNMHGFNVEKWIFSILNKSLMFRAKLSGEKIR